MSTWRSTTEPRRVLRRLAAGLAVALLPPAVPGLAAAEPSARPVLQVDVPFPTADKPQAKLWQTGEVWWALLPRAGGPSLWERTPAGWREHAAVATELRGVPGRADVWAETDAVTAVTVADRMLAVVRLTRGPAAGAGWRTEVLARIGAPVSDVIETATLARDARGGWWIAAAVHGRIFAWRSPDARTWSAPTQVAGGLHVDDLGAVLRVPEGVAVVWSDQKADAVRIRTYPATGDVAAWGAPVTIAQGGQTADDHVSAATSADGTVWLATKNSRDEPGRPQLVLRVRDRSGRWSNHGYAPLADGEAPSRPLVIATPRPGEMLLGHVVYGEGRPRRDRIVFGIAAPGSEEVLRGGRTVIAPADAGSRVNDPTGPKAGFAGKGPWIVLASDAQGRVYEADLAGIPPGAAEAGRGPVIQRDAAAGR